MVINPSPVKLLAGVTHPSGDSTSWPGVKRSEFTTAHMMVANIHVHSLQYMLHVCRVQCFMLVYSLVFEGYWFGFRHGRFFTDVARLWRSVCREQCGLVKWSIKENTCNVKLISAMNNCVWYDGLRIRHNIWSAILATSTSTYSSKLYSAFCSC